MNMRRLEVDAAIAALGRLEEAGRKVTKVKTLAPAERKLERAMAKAFAAEGKAFGPLFKRSRAGQAAFAESASDWMDPLFTKAELATLKLFQEPLEEQAAAMLEKGALALVGQLAAAYTFTLKNPRAVRYLQAHGADLVKNIHETTRGDMRTIVQYGLDQGWSYNKVARAIQERFRGYYDPGAWWNFDHPRGQGHIDSRAHLIAVTEPGNAYEEGNAIVASDLTEAGLEIEKHWSTRGDDKVSEGCRENEAEGWILENQAHRSGHLHPLRFPGCRCDEIYRLKEEKA